MSEVFLFFFLNKDIMKEKISFSIFLKFKPEEKIKRVNVKSSKP